MSDAPPEWFDRYHGRPQRDPEADTWVEIAGEIRANTDRAVQLYDGSRTSWLPRSQIRPADAGDGPITLEVKHWIAKENGFI